MANRRCAEGVAQKEKPKRDENTHIACEELLLAENVFVSLELSLERRLVLRCARVVAREAPHPIR